MHFQQVQEFLGNFNLHANQTNYIISERKYRRVIETAVKWYGSIFGQFIADCFLDVIHSQYLFMPSSWEEMREAFEDSATPLLTYTHHPETFQKGR